ncbi:MAG TPA: DEAD/DEAH box helicase, partial [Sandaracinaceae bacterium]
PARVRDFDPRQLDERGALGQLVWVGAGALGERDGRIALYRRERAALLLEPPAPPAELAPLARALLDHLARRGASFFGELVGAASAAGAGDPEREALEALWDLVWAGLVTNDTFAPLRALAARGRQESARARRPGRHGAGAALAAAGRWSLVAQLADPPADPTRRAHARALALLDRWGVVARDALEVEAIPGGFSAVYPVLRAMEESGRLRRGHFVEGLAGAQFAFAGAVDQLRAARAPAARDGGAAGRSTPEALVLAACDPANPFGALLPWPPSHVPEARPRRAAGASVVLVDGLPVLFLDRAGRQATTFAAAHEEPDAFPAAAGALRMLLLDRRRRGLRIERIDGVPALDSPLREAFLAAGFRAEYKGLALDRFGAEPTPGAP